MNLTELKQRLAVAVKLAYDDNSQTLFPWLDHREKWLKEKEEFLTTL